MACVSPVACVVLGVYGWDELQAIDREVSALLLWPSRVWTVFRSSDLVLASRLGCRAVGGAGSTVQWRELGCRLIELY